MRAVTGLLAAVIVGVVASLWSPAPGTAAGKPVILFDEGHGQPFRAGGRGDLDLSGFAELVRAAGGEVRVAAKALDDRELAGAGALVISGTFAPLGPADIVAVTHFIARGGRVAVMIHIAPPVEALLRAIGVQHSRAPLREVDGVIGGRPTNFTVTRFDRHFLTEGLERIGVFGCYSVRSRVPEARIIAGTGPRAWPDTDGNGRPSGTEPIGVHGVIVAGQVGAGEFAVFGDDAIFQNRFLASHNRALGERLARWLAGATAGPAAPGRATTIPL